MPTLAGLDLAWKDHNPSALAIGTLHERTLTLTHLYSAIIGLPNLSTYLAAHPDLTGIAIDAPLIIPNATGQRTCEVDLSADYRRRKAATHASNQTRYPNAFSVQLAEQLSAQGFSHLGRKRWQIECYPHPALIEILGLTERHLYKKGRVADKQHGQIALADYLKQLSQSAVLALHLPDEIKPVLSAQHIHSLNGRALKTNEDALDAIICLYIAALYQLSVPAMTYGDAQAGYIWVPQTCCLAY